MPERDNADLARRGAEAKQALLLALKQANAAVLDGNSDPTDLHALADALDQTKRARDMLDVLHKRLFFHHEIGKLLSGTMSDDSSRLVINLVRLGVDAGYDVADVRRKVDEAMGRT